MIVKRPISKAFIILSLFAILLLVFSTSGFSTIYYVNTASTGTGDGTTQEITGEHAAWKAISEITGLVAGDSVLFNKGNEWRERLYNTTAGSDGSPITFGAYGEGADPIINGADVVATWTEYYGTPETWAAFTLANDGSANDYCFRSLIAASTFAASGDQIQVTLEANSANNSVFTSVYIGQQAASGDAWDMESGTVAEITFDSGSGCTITAGETKTSDWIDYSFDKTKAHFISFGNTGYVRYKSSGGTSYYKADASGEAGTADTADYSSSTNVYYLDEMEVRAATANVWQAALTTEPTQVFFDGTRGTAVGSIALCNGVGKWYWAANVLYIYYEEDPDGAVVIEASIRAVITIDGDSANYITIQNLDLKYADYHNINLRDGADHIIIDNITSQGAYDTGINCNDSNGPAVDLVTVSNSTINYNGAYGIGALRYATNWTIENNIVYNNCLSPDFDSVAGIATFDTTSTGHIIQDNTVYGNGVGNSAIATGVGIWIDTTGSGVIVRRNKVYDNDREGIYCEKNGSGVSVYYNLVWDNGCAGINVYGTNALPADSNTVYNNVSYSNDEAGIEVNGDSDADSCVDNTFKNNISVGNTLWDFWAHNGGENDGTNGSGNVYTYNCFGAESADFIKWGATEYSTYDTWETAYGSGTNSVEADPLMTDPANDNFHLNPHSPCVNAGTDVSLTEDYEGLKIRHAPDIGAYENQTNVLFFSWNYLRKFWK